MGHLPIGIFFMIAIAISGLYLTRISLVLIFAVLVGFYYHYLVFPPIFSFSLLRPDDRKTLIVLYGAAIICGSLIQKLRQQGIELKKREENTQRLYVLARQLAQSQSLADAATTGCEAMGLLLDQTIALFLLDRQAKGFELHLHPCSSFKAPIDEGSELRKIVHQDFEQFSWELTSRGHPYFPLIGRGGIVGLMLVNRQLHPTIKRERGELVETFASQIAVALEREILHDRSRAVELMEQTQKLYKTLLNSVSHELKTPLVSITGSASALLDSETMRDPNLMPVLAGEILVASQRLRRVVENLLDMSRIESGMLKPRREVCDVKELLAVVVQKLESDADAQGPLQSIALLFEPINTDIYVDPVLVEQAFTNIIQNAQQYTPKGTRVEISVQQSDEQVLVVVRDHGPGLPPEDVGKVFQKFYRGSPQNPGGLGLGLAIAEGFIEAQGGRIAAANAPGGGAVFKIELPAWSQTL